MESVVEVLTRMGGTATRRQLVAATSRTAVERCIAGGDVVRLARGRWALPACDDALAAASRASGIVSHTSAALLHGWEVKTVPEKPHVTVPRKRRVSATCSGSVVHRADLAARDVDGLVTSKRRTLVDCLRALPLDEAVAVADSALRDGWGAQSLAVLADSLRGAGSGQARRVAAMATGLADNPFESVLRVLALQAGLDVEPQVEIREPHFLGRVDLADRGRRIVLEADSFAWHGSREQLAADCRRYNAFVVHGWLVLRFSWEDVMLHPETVLATLVAVAEQAEVLQRRRRPA